MLQKFVQPKGSNNTLVFAVWSPLVLVADEGWTITTRARAARNRVRGGTHGFDNALPSMGALFVAAVYTGLALWAQRNSRLRDLAQSAAGMGVVGIHLDLTGTVPGINEAEFLALAEEAKVGCPISQLLKSVPITLNAHLAVS
jgi:hypothetical protein